MVSHAQFGCGLTAPEGWVNFDASPRLRLERLPGVHALMGRRAYFPENVRYGDIIAGLPLPDGSLDGLYSSHVLEHIYREDVEVALRNCLQVLKPGGIFRLVVPDLGWRIDEYIRTRGTPEVTEQLHKRLHLRPRAAGRGLEGRLRAAIGLSQHQWMYDEPLMWRLLEEAGFTAIRRCTFNDCEDPAFAAVEEHKRFVAEGFDELALECRRP